MESEMVSATLVEVGPWGGEGGGIPYRFKANLGDRITKIGIKATADFVTSIVFTYRDEESGTHTVGPFGGTAGVVKTITFDDDEQLTLINGTLGKNTDEDTILIRSFTFQTSKMKTYNAGATPVAGDATFSLPVAKGMVTGFFGHYSQFLDSFGVILRPE